MASRPLVTGVATSFYAALAPAKGTWYVGSYTTVITINGAEDTGDYPPISWTVHLGRNRGCGGSGKPFRSVNSHSVLHPHHRGAISARVRSSRKPVAEATVVLDGRGVGISRERVLYTNGKGQVRFIHLKPERSGHILIKATKKGYIGATTGVLVRR